MCAFARCSSHGARMFIAPNRTLCRRVRNRGWPAPSIFVRRAPFPTNIKFCNCMPGVGCCFHIVFMNTPSLIMAFNSALQACTKCCPRCRVSRSSPDHSSRCRSSSSVAASSWFTRMTFDPPPNGPSAALFWSSTPPVLFESSSGEGGTRARSSLFTCLARTLTFCVICESHCRSGAGSTVSRDSGTLPQDVEADGSSDGSGDSGDEAGPSPRTDGCGWWRCLFRHSWYCSYEASISRERSCSRSPSLGGGARGGPNHGSGPVLRGEAGFEAGGATAVRARRIIGQGGGLGPMEPDTNVQQVAYSYSALLPFSPPPLRRRRDGEVLRKFVRRKMQGRLGSAEAS
mmetsp:Transcript_21686/g.53086  ORF Transcript_21686/g.53086 Transcript_21686/m.53086 type:complete len:344 (+) Transcript_21686:644-1675(+)